MTTTIAFANTNDAYLFSGNNSYATALAGSSLGISSTSDTTLFVGQQKSGTPYTIWQAFLQFGFTDTALSSTVSGYFRLTSSQVTGTGVSRGLDIATFNWGTLTTADWRTPAQLATLFSSSKAGGVSNVHSASNLTVRAGYLKLTELDTAATLQHVVSTSRNRLQSTPTGLEYNGFRSADYSGTDTDPALFVAEIQDSRLSRSLGAQVQLSTGAHVYIEHTSAATLGNDAFNVVYRTIAGVASNIAAISDTIGGTIKRGAQSHTLVRDSSDNVYVLYQSDVLNSLQLLAYQKSSPGSYLSVASTRQALPTADSDINNVVAAWHPAGGSLGTIVAIVSHQAGSNTGTEVSYLLLSCDYLINGTGSLLRGSGNAVGSLIAATSIDGFHNFTNETGTLLDIAQSGGSASNTGFVMSTARHHVLGQNAGQSVARYTLNATGTGFAEVWNFYDSNTGFSVKDANAKSRVLPISATQYATVNASNTSGRGIVVKHRQQQADQFTVLSEVDLDAQGLSTMPSASTVSVANNWDAIYNPLDNKVWVYYFDTANARRLMRTSIDLNTGQSGQDQVEVNSTVGVTGSSNLAIRVHRGSTIGEQMLVSVANLAGASNSSIYVADTINVAPSQPTLITRANFDANTSALFDWNFVDLNTSDTQSAYRLTIDNATTGATGYDSGKISSVNSNATLAASALPNGQNWKWRVMTWDSHDVASPWSDYGFFTTSSTGVINITDPATDNDPNIVTANYLVRWSVANTTQSAYNIVVTRTDTGATLITTGWVASVATQYLVVGMASDIEWNVAIKIRNAALIESNTASRKITPNYNRPEVPVISFDIMDDMGYIGLNITNPDPVGDRPNPTVNEIHRRVYSQTNPNLPYQILGETDPNGTFLDYTAASGVLYEYRVRAIAGEFFQDSTPTVADRELDLDGVWLHDPTDAAITARQFLYGKDSRSTAIDTSATVQQFAGRTFPVTDFGEYETEDISVSVDIPHGPTHRTEESDLRGFMELKKTLFFRDNRGRAAYGTMSGFNQADQAWGANVGFKFGRVSYDIEEV